jgi:large subunit ribosomal protein L25
MAEEGKLVAEVRNSFGKGAARKIRAAGKIPAVIYGHGTDTQHISLPGHETMLLIRKANAVLDLDVAGKQQLTLVKDVQKDPVHQVIEHMDLVIVRKGEKVQVDVPVHVTGESVSGTIVSLDAATILIEAEATHIPENIVVNVDGLDEGKHVLAKDVTLPAGSSLLSDPETLVVAISVPAAVVEEESAVVPEEGEIAESSAETEVSDEAEETAGE